MSPNYLRKFAGLGFLGGILIICETISAVLNTGYLIPIFLSIGSVLIVFSFLVRPQLGFILPFRAYSLYVFETKGGIPLFTNIWDDLIKNDDLADLISPVLQGISGLLNECFQKGEIREVLLSEASIMITRNEWYATAILANKSSPYLRDALENFNREFSLKFQNKVEYVNDTRYFESASEIFNKYFRFIPERKKGEMEIAQRQKRKSEIIVTDPIKPATKSLHT
jgi:hypothetical protein